MKELIIPRKKLKAYARSKNLTEDEAIEALAASALDMSVMTDSHVFLTPGTDACKITANASVNFPVSLMKESLAFNVSLIHAVRTLHKYKALVHTVVKGRVVTHRGDHVVINVDGEPIGMIFASHFIPGEFYVKGLELYFYVLKVGLRGGRAVVYLSRTSIRLPELILSLWHPTYSFKCVKRRPGKYCRILCDPLPPKESLVRLSRMLNGEYVDALIASEFASA